MLEPFKNFIHKAVGFFTPAIAISYNRIIIVLWFRFVQDIKIHIIVPFKGILIVLFGQAPGIINMGDPSIISGKDKLGSFLYVLSFISQLFFQSRNEFYSCPDLVFR